MSKMKAAVCHEPMSMTIEDVKKPRAEEDEVIVQVRASGVCGSDVDGYTGEHPWINLPMILGHECSGVVDEVGPDVEEIRVGDEVVVEPLLACGECRNCLRGQYNMCRDVIVLGHQVDGTFAEYVKTTKKYTHMKPPGVDFAVAALAEPISGALHGVGRCDLSIGDTVVVIGCGTIGYFLAQHAVNSGARVVVIEPVALKRQAAKDVGVEKALDPDKDDVEQVIMDMTDGMGADCVMEAVGIAGTVEQTVGLTRKGGKILLMGWTGRETDAFDCTNVTLDEITVLGTMGFAFDFPVTLDLMARNKIDAERIITHKFAIDETEKAIQTLHEGGDDVWKAVVEI